MGAGVLAIALRPELVALVACAADSPPNGTGSAGSPRGRTVGVLAVLGLWSRPGEMGVVHAYVLLEVLEGIVGSLGEAVEAAVKVARLDMAVGEEGGRRNCVVGGEPVKRVGQHVVRRFRV